jgi:hypothetical protein
VAKVDEPGFLGRWARRKADVRDGKPLTEPAVEVPVPVVVAPVPKSLPAVSEALSADPAVASDTAEEARLPTLDDVQALALDGDFKPFMAQGVTPEVKNAAMKKLFTDPHYNIMDGLDTYIDDYSKPDPIPESMLRNMVSAQFLKLFDEEEKDADNDAGVAKAVAPVRDDAYDPAAQSVAQSYASTDIATPPTLASPDAAQAELAHGDTTSHHANTDLRLQPDDAPATPRTERGAE